MPLAKLTNFFYNVCRLYPSVNILGPLPEKKRRLG